MELLVTYDVSTESAAGRRRLRKMSQACLAFGQRVQKSVFECSVDEMQYETLRHRLLDVIDQGEDSLRIYRLRGKKGDGVEHFGVNPSVDFDEPMVV